MKRENNRYRFLPGEKVKCINDFDSTIYIVEKYLYGTHLNGDIWKFVNDNSEGWFGYMFISVDSILVLGFESGI